MLGSTTQHLGTPVNAKGNEMRLGTIVRCWRVVQGKTIEDLSQQMGVPVSTYSRWERGRPVDTATFLKIFFWLIQPEEQQQRQ